jgi:hypothetical protein
LKRHLPRHCFCAVMSVETTLQFLLCWVYPTFGAIVYKRNSRPYLKMYVHWEEHFFDISHSIYFYELCKKKVFLKPIKWNLIKIVFTCTKIDFIIYIHNQKGVDSDHPWLYVLQKLKIWTNTNIPRYNICKNSQFFYICLFSQQVINIKIDDNMK